ncbi:hypothetical protein HK101_003257, partial [Irineochytrium annulatum]
MSGFRNQNYTNSSSRVNDLDDDDWRDQDDYKDTQPAQGTGSTYAERMARASIGQKTFLTQPQ